MRKAQAKILRAPAKVGLSIILPTHDDGDHLERHLPSLITYLKTLDVTYEILISDDGGEDPVAISHLCEKYDCRLVRSARNHGKGAAVRRAMAVAKGKVRIFTDSDVPFRFAAIGEMYRRLERGEADVICGDRTSARSNYFDSLSPVRRTASRVFASVARRFLGNANYDTQCGLKGFRAEAADKLFSVGRINRFAFDVELLHLAFHQGLRVVKQPVTLRVQDSSQVNPLRDGSRMIWDLLRIFWFSVTGRYGKAQRKTGKGR